MIVYKRYKNLRRSRTKGERSETFIRFHASASLTTFLLILANKVSFHSVAYEVSAEKKSLADVTGFTGASKILLRLHGAFMVTAWIGTASIGILIARYFRQTWVGSSLCGKDHWFAVSYLRAPQSDHKNCYCNADFSTTFEIKGLIRSRNNSTGPNKSIIT